MPVTPRTPRTPRASRGATTARTRNPAQTWAVAPIYNRAFTLLAQQGVNVAAPPVPQGRVSDTVIADDAGDFSSGPELTLTELAVAVVPTKKAKSKVYKLSREHRKRSFGAWTQKIDKELPKAA